VKRKMKRIIEALILIVMLFATVSLAYGVFYEKSEDLSGDGKIDAWYADTTGNFRFDRWAYDIDGDGYADYYQYDLNNNCYAEYTNAVFDYVSGAVGSVAKGNGQVNHWYADLNEIGFYNRKNYDSNADGLADIYTYDWTGDGIFDEVRVDSTFAYIRTPGQESWSEWYLDTNADGIYDTCRYDLNGDYMFSYADDLEIVNSLGCYNYTFVLPVTTNVVYNRWAWPCEYNTSSGVSVTSLLAPTASMMVTRFFTGSGELFPVSAGEEVTFRVSVFNAGEVDFTTTRFTMSIPELGIRAPRQMSYEFNQGNYETMLFNIEIPSDAVPGEYMVRFHALTNEGIERTKHRILIVK
jgi:hypothetical protein